jgi:succinoglycan biosynthesis protein ExoO
MIMRPPKRFFLNVNSTGRFKNKIERDFRSVRTGRYAVLVTDRTLMPATRGNRVRIMGLIRCLRAAGWSIAVVGSDVGRLDEVGAEVDDLVIVRAAHSLNGGNPASFMVQPYRRAVAQIAAALRAEVVIAEYAWLAPALANLPGTVRRYVDCHDLLHERRRRFIAAGLDPWIDCSKQEERRLLRYADVLIAIQHRDATQLKRLLPDKRVVCLLPYIDLPPNFQPVSSDSFTVLAGGADHAGNKGICEFAGKPWQNIIDAIPQARLKVFGSIGAQLPITDGVEALGIVNDLYKQYQSVAVVVCPVAVGTGLKIKMIEALRFGKAIVATEAAAEGLPPATTQSWITVGSVTECAVAVATLLRNPSARKQLEKAAFAYGQKYLSKETAVAELNSILPGRVSSVLSRLIS